MILAYKDIFCVMTCQQKSNKKELLKIHVVLSKQERNQKLEAVVRRCSAKKVFLEISQNSQENTCARIYFLIRLQAQAYNFST